jgi:hypothetical protein
VAKIIKTQEVEIGLEELIKLIKKNWGLLAGFLTSNLINGSKNIKIAASFNLVSIGAALHKQRGLIVGVNELVEAIIQIFKEIENQNPHFKNVEIEFPAPHKNLNVSFEIDISPVMPVDPLDIELGDLALKQIPIVNRVESDPDKTEARSFMSCPSPSSGNEIYGV